MPRTSDKSDALRDMETFIKSATCDYLLASTSSEEENAEENIEDLLCIHKVLVSYRYLSLISKHLHLYSFVPFTLLAP